MSISISPNLPANVVEIGNEITQAKINEINSGTLALQSWVTSGFAPKDSPTFTGIVTIPAGASITGYLTTSLAASTYLTIANASTTYLTVATASSTYQPIGSYLTDAPNDGNEYVRKNLAWSVSTGGGGGLTISSLSNAAATTLNATAPTTGQALTFDGTELKWSTVGGGGGGVAWGGITGTVTDQTDLTTYLSGTYYPSSNPSGYLTSVPTKTVNAVGGTYTLSAGDQNKIIFMNGGMSGNALTVPADSTYAFPNGTEITIVCDLGPGTNQVSGQFAGQPTFNGNSAWSVTISNSVSKLVKIDTDIWYYS